MLKQILTANALFSAGAALIMLIAPARLATHIPLPPAAWAGLGIGLLVFAAQLVWMAARPALAQKLTPQVIASDWAWVVLTAIALLAGWQSVTATGVALIVAVNVIVATFAVLQRRAFRAHRIAV